MTNAHWRATSSAASKSSAVWSDTVNSGLAGGALQARVCIVDITYATQVCHSLSSSAVLLAERLCMECTSDTVIGFRVISSSTNQVV